MSKDGNDDSAATEEIPDQRASRVEWPLVKEPGAALESHGAHFSFLDFEIDLDRFVGEFNEQVIGAYGQGAGAVLPADTGIARSPGSARHGRLPRLSPTWRQRCRNSSQTTAWPAWNP